MTSLLAEFGDKFRDFESYALRAQDIEHNADAVTHEIIDRLNKTFITPIDRQDIYLLAHEIDDVIDLIENVIRNIFLYRITKKINALGAFIPLIQKSGGHLEQLLEHLPELVHTPKFKSIIVKVHELEDAGDAIFDKSIDELFQNEKDPVALIKTKDILEDLEEVMDKCQRVGDIIEGIIVKSG